MLAWQLVVGVAIFVGEPFYADLPQLLVEAALIVGLVGRRDWARWLGLGLAVGWLLDHLWLLVTFTSYGEHFLFATFMAAATAIALAPWRRREWTQRGASLALVAIAMPRFVELAPSYLAFDAAYLLGAAAVLARHRAAPILLAIAFALRLVHEVHGIGWACAGALLLALLLATPRSLRAVAA